MFLQNALFKLLFIHWLESDVLLTQGGIGNGS